MNTPIIPQSTPEAAESGEASRSAARRPPFAGTARIHVALPVRDVTQSQRFYEVLLGTEPAKIREGYVKFEAADPAVNLTLNASPDAVSHHPVAHFGVQVKSTEAVRQRHERLRAAGYETASEEGVTCCFAVQDKIWATDPDGHRWEVFVVLDADAAVHSAPLPSPTGRLGEAQTPREPCCS